jgi:hypothetical protein
VWRIDWETSLADEILEICDHRIHHAEDDGSFDKGEFLENQDLFGILVGMRACRT